jgi:hypothetical protein
MPGHKEAYRLYSSDGRALIDLLQLPDEEPPQVAQCQVKKQSWVRFSDGRALVDLLQLPDEEPPQVAQS